ncbi:tudor domain-containing protein 15 [Genypterus blacodes]|uniref:tudor domain-containing protein 15 n=1 Tax=Genypterus blacodes TaxID=154954 RepID=UPI003F758A6F
MHSLGSKHTKSRGLGPSAPCVDLKLTHLDWSPEADLIHFQGQHLAICDQDYNILQVKLQHAPKTKTVVDVGEFCLVEDLTSAHWYRGRVQNRKEDLFDVFLIDHGNVLTVDITNLSSCSNDLLTLPPKVVCGFLGNLLLHQDCSHSLLEAYFLSLIGRNISGYIQALLPHNVLIFEAPKVNSNVVKQGFGRLIDTNTFLLLAEMLMGVPIKQNKEPDPDLQIENPREEAFSFNSASLQGYYDILSFCRPTIIAGTKMKVRLTATFNPKLFYCQMTSMETDLRLMSENLAAVCEYGTKHLSQKPPENLGQLCSVKGKDEKWYRGFIQYLPINAHTRVLFIDYGYFETVKIENIHGLPSEFCSKPFMAFPCSLYVNDQDEAVKAQQLSFLKAGLLGGVLDVEINRFDKERNLYSLTVLRAKGNNLKELKAVQELPKKKAGTLFETEKSVQGGYLFYETIIGEMLAKTLEEEGVYEGSVFVGFVEHVLNPTRFWIRTKKRNDDFEEMVTKMVDHFSHVKLDEEALMHPEPGTLCCAMYEKDMHFYRAVVTGNFAQGVEVLFIDYGNVGKVPHMLIKNIPAPFASRSAFAFGCSLVNVAPLNELWTNEDSDFFREAVSNKAMLVHVVRLTKNNCVVNLCEMKDGHNQSITELLISTKHAEYLNCHQEPEVQSKTNALEKTVRRGPSYSATSHICETTHQWDDLERNENATKVLQEEHPSKITKHHIAAGFKALRFKPGCEFAVHCSHITSVSDFWCQPINKLPALEALMDRVQQYYTTHTIPFQLGDSCCVAKSPIDGKWYRGFISEQENGHVEVMLVDYGPTVQITHHNLQKILPEFLEQGEHAFRCSLYNVIKPVGPQHCRNWSSEVLNSLWKFVQRSSAGLRCEVVLQLNMKDKGLCNVVDLYNTQTYQSITNILMENGLSKEMEISTMQLSSMYPESFAYSPFNLSTESEEQVYITHVTNQWEVYCNLDRNTDIIEKLQNNISEESVKMQNNTAAVVRNLCLAKYLDGNWYRGLALPCPSPLHLSVFFVDYGNTTILKKTSIVFIPWDSADLLYTPMQAVKFSLASVSKKELYPGIKEWLDETILNKKVRAVIVGKKDDGSFDVELFDGDVNINEQVKDLILSQTPKPKAVVHFTIRCTNTKHTAVYKSHSGPSSRGNSQPKQMVSHSSYTTSKASSVPKLYCLPNRKVTTGFRAECYVSFIESVSSFFLQFSKDEPAILKMTENLNSDLFRHSLKTTSWHLRINDLVLAEYKEDGALYRSVVKDYEGNDAFRVEYVDFGNTGVIAKEKIYSITKEYLSQPRFSIASSLLDTGNYKNDAAFIDAVMEKPLMVDFVRLCKSHWKVNINVPDRARGLPVALESAVKSISGTEKDVLAPALTVSSPETEEMFGSCGLSSMKGPATESEKTMVKEEKPRLNSLSTRQESITTNRNEMNPGKERAIFKTSDHVGTILPTFQVRETENGTVLSVLHNGDFYIRPNKDHEQLVALEHLIDKNLNKCEVMTRGAIKQGLRCLIQGHKETQWHRAVVKHVAQDKWQAFLLDLGITKEVTEGSIRELCSDLTNIPNLAVLCRVNLGTCDGQDTHKFWHETLKPMIGKDVKLVFVCFSQRENMWMVELVLNELFLIQALTISHQHSEEVIPASTETQNMWAAEEISVDTSFSQPFFHASVEIDKVYVGFAAAVMTPSKFCVSVKDLVLMDTMSQMLDDLTKEMSPLPEFHLIPGTCCLLRSDLKNKWCRAEIVHVDTTVVLNLVDYGHCIKVPYEDHIKLKKVPGELRGPPKVTYLCTLRGVRPVDMERQWTLDAAVFFQKSLYQKDLQIIFRDLVSDTLWEVSLMADGVDVAKNLVDAGHARYADVSWRFQEQRPCSEEDSNYEGAAEEFVDAVEDFQGMLNVCAEAASKDEAEAKMPLRSSSGHQCVLL